MHPEAQGIKKAEPTHRLRLSIKCYLGLFLRLEITHEAYDEEDG